MLRRVLSILLVLAALLAPVAAEAGSRAHRRSPAVCTEGNLCWPRGGRSFRSVYRSDYDRYDYDRDPVIVVVPTEKVDPDIKVVREPGLIDIPVGILNFGLGLAFGRTKLVDTSCPDTDKACHDARAREAARHDAKTEIADQSGEATYRATYNETIRNSGLPFEPAGKIHEEDLETEE